MWIAFLCWEPHPVDTVIGRGWPRIQPRPAQRSPESLAEQTQIKSPLCAGHFTEVIVHIPDNRAREWDFQTPPMRTKPPPGSER